MADFADLSDQQLQQKLKEYGFDSIPVSTTTRDVAIRMLRKAVTKKDDRPSSERRRKSKIVPERDESTDEEPDFDAAHGRKSTRVATPKKDVQPSSPSVNSGTRRRSARLSAIPGVPETSPRLPNGDSPNRSVPRKSVHRASTTNSIIPGVPKSTPTSPFLLPSKTFAVPRSPVSSWKRGEEYDTASDTDTEFSRPKKSPYAQSTGIFNSVGSLFTKTTRRDIGSNISPNGHFGNGARSVNTHTATSSSDGSSFWNSQSVPRNLLAGALLFFVVIGGIYWFMCAREAGGFFGGMKSKYNITVCSESRIGRDSSNCIPRDIIDETVVLFTLLHAELKYRSDEHQCGIADVSPNMLVLDSKTFLQTKLKNKLSSTFDRSFEALLTLIRNNPGSGLQILNTKGAIAENEYDTPHWILHKSQAPVTASGMLWMMQCWLQVVIGNVIYLGIVVTLVCAAVFVSYRSIVWWMAKRQEEERLSLELAEKVLSLLQDHRRALATAGDAEGRDAYLAVNHVRDHLIPLSKRDAMAGAWERTVKYITLNESRVREEVQRVAGEDCRVWRWLPTPTLPVSVARLQSRSPLPSSTPNSSFNVTPPRIPRLYPTLPDEDSTEASGSSNLSKSPVSRSSWQGKAFEMTDGSVNRPPYSPTSCLKIRHMFDPQFEIEEEWPVQIHNAVIEKCGNGAQILHIGVDRNSPEGCVYVKCLSREAAGQAYQALHGWWFNGNLVTVKYLREERYHERFPASATATELLTLPL